MIANGRTEELEKEVKSRGREHARTRTHARTPAVCTETHAERRTPFTPQAHAAAGTCLTTHSHAPEPKRPHLPHRKSPAWTCGTEAAVPGSAARWHQRAAEDRGAVQGADEQKRCALKQQPQPPPPDPPDPPPSLQKCQTCHSRPHTDRPDRHRPAFRRRPSTWRRAGLTWRSVLRTQASPEETQLGSGSHGSLPEHGKRAWMRGEEAVIWVSLEQTSAALRAAPPARAAAADRPFLSDRPSHKMHHLLDAHGVL